MCGISSDPLQAPPKSTLQDWCQEIINDWMRMIDWVVLHKEIVHLAHDIAIHIKQIYSP